jgi:hypothetical protein
MTKACCSMLLSGISLLQYANLIVIGRETNYVIVTILVKDD